ncbi:MAG: hypothetical protein WBG86_02110 [Polyangiales bacterium]
MGRLIGIFAFFALSTALQPEAHAHPLLDEAVASYEEAGFQEALRAFDDAAHNADLTVDELLYLFEMRALVHHALGDRAAMDRDLLRIAVVRPSYRLGGLAPPPVREAFDGMLAANGGSIGVSLVIEEKTFDGVPFVVATVDQVPLGLVDHVRLHCRLGKNSKSVVRTAEGSQVTVKLPASGTHNGCDASAHTRQGDVLFQATVDGSYAHGASNVFEMPRYVTPVDEPTARKRKKWPWIVAAIGAAAVAGITAGVVLSKRSGDDQTAPGGVTVNW